MKHFACPDWCWVKPNRAASNASRIAKLRAPAAKPLIAGLRPYLSFLKTTPFEGFASYTLSVIPLFLLMGNVAAGAGLSKRLFAGANALVGHYRGGLAM